MFLACSVEPSHVIWEMDNSSVDLPKVVLQGNTDNEVYRESLCHYSRFLFPHNGMAISILNQALWELFYFLSLCCVTMVFPTVGENSWFYIKN